MPFPLAGLLGGMIGTRALHAGSVAGASFLKSPIIQGGGFGLGYTSGAYGGYGVSNTWDPLGVHKPKYKHYQQKLRLPSGYYGPRYGGYRRRYSRFRRYRGYWRRSSYRRGYY